MVQFPGQAVVQPPNAAAHHDAGRSGVIEYKSKGFFAGKRRADALRQMKRACPGGYRIDSEMPRVESETIQVDADVVVDSAKEYTALRFSCTGGKR